MPECGFGDHERVSHAKGTLLLIVECVPARLATVVWASSFRIV
jgi:hypothetical protein